MVRWQRRPAAGGRRPQSIGSSSFPRPEDGFVVAQDPEFDIEAVEDLPNVEAAAKATFLFLVLVDDRGQPLLDQFSAIAPFVLFFTKGEPGSMNRPNLIAGRLPDPSKAEEILIDEDVAAKRNLRVGSQLNMQAFSPEQADDALGGVLQAPAGPRLTFTVAGIGRTPSDLDPTAVDPNVIYQGSAEIVLGEAFWDRYGDEVGTAESIEIFRAVRLAHGAADIDEFTAAVRALPHGDTAFVQFGTADSVQAAERARDAVALETSSLTALAVVLGVAGAVLCGLRVGSPRVDRHRRVPRPAGARRATQ